VPPFPKPRFAYDYDLSRELGALRAYRKSKPGYHMSDRRPLWIEFETE
jgi:hypothetical protein